MKVPDPQDEAGQLRAELRNIRISDLLLDPLNPRLPEELQGQSQPALLRYLFDNAVLDELGKSYLDNGYFLHEPVIVTPSATAGRFDVLEGNRRLAALLILLQEPPAREADLRFSLERDPTAQERQQLVDIPSYVVPEREDVHRFLGFRHIGGIKTWSAEAKARYLHAEVEKIAPDTRDPFAVIGRRVGSNALGVRNSFVAYATMRAASSEFGIDTGFVIRNRFGVWLRAMNSPELRRHIGLDPLVSGYQEVQEGLLHLDPSGLAELVADLTPRSPGEKAVLRDSRDVTVYASVISNPTAHEVLRRFDDLQVARQVVERAELPGRIRLLTKQVDLIRDEVQRAEPSDELSEAVAGLYASARAVRSIARDRADDDGADAG